MSVRVEQGDPYQAFLARKAVGAPERGLDLVPDLAPHLFPFQRHSVGFGLKVGCAGFYHDTGLGKTEMQLDWCRHALEAGNGRALILTPLVVASQTNRRAERWGYSARVVREQGEAGPGINICNYDRLDKIDPSYFGAVSLDEASILKSFTGKTTRRLIEAFAGHRFKLAATATPAPNDHMELGQHAEFLGVMKSQEMLSRWFINDTGSASQHWRLKGHAARDFWRWMASWARVAEKPSDLGGDDDGFILPPFKVHRHRAQNSAIDTRLQDLFGGVAMTATSTHEVKRQTAKHRADTVAAIVANEPDTPWLLWCDTNYEADAIKKAVPAAIEVRGSMSIDEKEARLDAFSRGDELFLIAKPSMCGFGLDWSHCARMVFAGRSYSYETWYQAVRRCWRFGQTRDVHVHLVVAEGENEIGRVIDRKADDHGRMKSEMRRAMLEHMNGRTARAVPYDPTYIGELPTWL